MENRLCNAPGPDDVDGCGGVHGVVDEDEGRLRQPRNPKGQVGGDLPALAHHEPLHEDAEPGRHGAVDEEVDGGVEEEEQVGYTLQYRGTVNKVYKECFWRTFCALIGGRGKQ